MAFLQACVDRNAQLQASSYYRKVLGLDQQQRTDPPKDETEPVAPTGTRPRT
jgi:hypothetical protein